MVNKKRLAETFLTLVSIDSPSREEGAMAAHVKNIFSVELGADVFEDLSSNETGSQCGNVIARMRGKESVPPLFFNAHLDTVEPGRGVEPVLEDGVFRSRSNTVLGGDDKAAVAILIEVARLLKERNMEHGTLEFLFTVCEEIGLLGAKALDVSLLEARSGYALDSTDTGTLINQAPAAIRFNIRVKGRAAHAGINPENGINAIQIASTALSQVSLGQVDEDTTTNVGIIQGGNATNIVPDTVDIQGEVRSHDPDRLRQVQDAILGTFHRVIMEERKRRQEAGERLDLPAVQTEVMDDYPMMCVAPDHPLVVTAFEAADALGGRPLCLERTGGGSDANVLNGKGIATVIMGIGMQKVHTIDEYISLDDMVQTAELVLAIIEEWTRNGG